MKIADMTAWHKSQIGVTEWPPKSNNVKYNTEFYGHEVKGNYPWCCAYIWCGFYENGATALMPKTASCTNLMNWAKDIGAWVTSGYKEGDIILYNFDRYPDADHVGYCISATSKSVTCIEGNTSATSADNGGAVMKVNRKLNVVLGAYRPDYAGTKATVKPKVKESEDDLKLPELKKGSAGNSVKALQMILMGLGYSVGYYGADGDFGSNTHDAVVRFQGDHGLETDGIVGYKTWSKLLL